MPARERPAAKLSTRQTRPQAQGRREREVHAAWTDTTRRAGAPARNCVLIVSANVRFRRAAAKALGAHPETREFSGVLQAGTCGDAVKQMNALGAASTLHAAIIDVDLPDAPGYALIDAVREVRAAPVMVARGAGVDDAVAAMRAGALDLLDRSADLGELAPRVASAARSARLSRERELRVVKLERMCRRLSASRQHVVRQVGELCTDLVQAYQELADTMSQVTTATEFKGLIRQELDIESLLRTTLEFVLARSGPTNAAVFLPTTSGDFSLGAYVNYDCPKDTVDILLDHMANVIAPRFENVPNILHLTNKAELDRYIGDDAAWIGDSHVIGFPCINDGECLAIFMIFRDSRAPFGQPFVDQLRAVAELFAQQLARVIRIHHRHLPKEKWGMLGDPEAPHDGYDDLAA